MTSQALPVSKTIDQDTAATRRVSVIVTALCFFALFAEGYDMGALGAVMPALLGDPVWRLGPGIMGVIASAALVGMFFGGYGFGIFADRYGRKWTLIACFTLFTVASGVAAIAPSPATFAFCRFLAGLGVGGIVPVAAALTSEYAPPGKANRQFALMYAGYSIGIFASALASFLLLERLGWRWVIGLGFAPILMVPVFVAVLPESIASLMTRGFVGKARQLAARLRVPVPEPVEPAADAQQPAPGVRALFAKGYVSATLGFWFATFCGMILVYGLNTWLPQIMRASGYSLGPSIMFLGVFSLASSIGGVLLGSMADRVGRGRVIMIAFGVGSVAILALARPWPLPVTYCIVAIAGVGSVAAAVMVTSYLSSYFPPRLRATAVGCCISFSRFGAVCGPLLGGLIAEYGLATTWNFVLFAVAAVLAGLSILLVPTARREDAAA